MSAAPEKFVRMEGDGGLPLGCVTCRYRKRVERDSPALMVGLPGHYCRQFTRSDSDEREKWLPCFHAYDTFCGGQSYRPDVWVRLLRFFNIIE